MLRLANSSPSLKCEVQVLRRLNRLRPRGETVVGTAAFNDTGPRHVKLLLELFR